MQDPALQDLVRRDLEEGNAAGVGGTPTVFINGKTYRGPRSLEGFSKAIDAELAKAGHQN
jgi:protein-disulfide isomerase